MESTELRVAIVSDDTSASKHLARAALLDYGVAEVPDRGSSRPLALASERLQRSGSRSTALLLQRDKAAVVAVSRPCDPGPADHIAPRDSFVNGTPYPANGVRVPCVRGDRVGCLPDRGEGLGHAEVDALGVVDAVFA
jgi:hypothetical protein